MSESEIIAAVIVSYVCLSFCMMVFTVNSEDRTTSRNILFINFVMFFTSSMFMIHLFRQTLDYNKEQQEKEMSCKRIGVSFVFNPHLSYFEHYAVDGVIGMRNQVSNFSTISSLRMILPKPCHIVNGTLDNCLTQYSVIPCWLQNVNGETVLLSYPDRHRLVLPDIIVAIVFCSFYLVVFVKIFVDEHYSNSSNILCILTKCCLNVLCGGGRAYRSRIHERRNERVNEIVVLPQPFFSDKCIQVEEVYIYDTNCSICQDSLSVKSKDDIIITKCKHLFCKKCIKQWKDTQHSQVIQEPRRNDYTLSCPLCRTHINQVFSISTSQIEVVVE